MKKILLLIPTAIAFAIFFYPIHSNSNSTGSPGGKTGSPTDVTSCTACHYAGNGNGATISTNIPSSGYVPNQVYTITAEVNQLGINKFGFEITSEEANPGSIKTGSFLITNNAETQFTNNNTAITHKLGGTSGSNSKTWSMDWEAPNTGTGSVTFYGSFVGSNGDNQNTGDTYHATTLTVNEVAIGVPGCTDSLALNYNSLATTDDGSCIYLNCIDSSLIDSTALCVMIWDPVCGCDSVTYSNDCVATSYAGVTSWTQGPCNSSTNYACIGGLNPGFTSCQGPGNYLLGQTYVMAVYSTMAACIADSCNVMPPPPPPCSVELTGDSSICNWGSPQILTATPNSSAVLPVTYIWNTGQTGPVLTINNPGIYCVTQTDANGCLDTACVTITVQDLPIYSTPLPPIICLGDSIVLEIDTIGLSNIIWVPNSLNTPSVHRIVDFPMLSTTYIVEAIDSAGCDRRGEIEVIIDSCVTGIMHTMSNNVLIYPNPAKGNMTISLPKFKIFDLSIYDITGKLVFSEDKISNTYIIPVNSLTKGSYILNLSHTKGIITKKLMIE